MNLFTFLIASLWAQLGWEPVTCKSVAAIHLQHQDKPQLSMNTHTNQDGIVIIGGGVIGLSTAYSLALSLQEIAKDLTLDQRSRLPNITVVESSDRLCPAASSKATGGLGDFGFDNGPTGLADLALLSYEMHKEMAQKYNGEKRYGFSSQVNIVPAFFLVLKGCS